MKFISNNMMKLYILLIVYNVANIIAKYNYIKYISFFLIFQIYIYKVKIYHIKNI